MTMKMYKLHPKSNKSKVSQTNIHCNHKRIHLSTYTSYIQKQSIKPKQRQQPKNLRDSLLITTFFILLKLTPSICFPKSDILFVYSSVSSPSYHLQVKQMNEIYRVSKSSLVHNEEQMNHGESTNQYKQTIHKPITPMTPPLSNQLSVKQQRHF